MDESITKQQIESSLKVVFSDENFKRFDINIVGNSEKGDGYLGDIIFVQLRGFDQNDTPRDYNLVLKCSKNNEEMREKSTIKEAFSNEIFFYKNVLPEFLQFQKERSVEKLFNNATKFYGAFTSDTSEIIVLQNLKTIGFDLWDRQKPLTRNHINLVVKAYGRLHATSVAMQDQEPKRFEGLLDGIEDILGKFRKVANVDKFFGSGIDAIHDVLQGSVDERVLEKWSDLKNQLNAILEFINGSNKGLRVISHGDCWNNNFMFKSVEEAIFLDWQIMRFSPPVLDLSYFLFTCISKEDIQDLDIILKLYHKSFSDHLRELGSDPLRLYPEKEFLSDWNKMSKFGILMVALILKIAIVDKDDAPDTKTQTEGEQFFDSFAFEINDHLKPRLRDRSEYIVKYAAENNII